MNGQNIFVQTLILKQQTTTVQTMNSTDINVMNNASVSNYANISYLIVNNDATFNGNTTTDNLEAGKIITSDIIGGQNQSIRIYAQNITIGDDMSMVNILGNTNVGKMNPYIEYPFITLNAGGNSASSVGINFEQFGNNQAGYIRVSNDGKSFIRLCIRLRKMKDLKKREK